MIPEQSTGFELRQIHFGKGLRRFDLRNRITDTIHDNTLEGMWTGLRNHLRIFRGVSKVYLHQYVAIFEWAYSMKRAMPEFLRALMGIKPSTNCRT